MDACLNPRDPNNLRRIAASSYTNDQHEEEATDDDDIKGGCVENSDSANGAHEDARAYIVDSYAVIDSAEDTAISSQQRPSVFRKLSDDLDLNYVAAAETALSVCL